MEKGVMAQDTDFCAGTSKNQPVSFVPYEKWWNGGEGTNQRSTTKIMT
jgi:hypothetical protein